MYKVSLSVETSSSSVTAQPVNYASTSFLESTEANRNAAWMNGEAPSIKVADMKYLFDYGANERIPEQLPKTFIDKEIDELRAREAEWKQFHPSLASPAAFPVSTFSEKKVELNTESFSTASGNSDLLINFDDSNNNYVTPKPTLFARGSPDSGYQDGGSDLKSQSSRSTNVRKSVTFEEVNNPQQKILNEIAEQQKKEEELRKHWKDMGLDVKFNDLLDDIDDSYNDHNIKSNGAIEATELKLENDVKLEATKQNFETKQEINTVTKTTLYSVESKPALVETSTTDVKITLSSRPGNDSASKTIETEVLSSKPTGTSYSMEPAKRALSVQPFSDDEDDDGEDKRFWLAPQTETLIQREIRAAREREEALRLARGLPSLLKIDQTDNSVVTIEVSKPARLPSVTLDHRDAMKKYAESRLQVELKKEKEKELALLRQGSIHTISEERIGEPAKFVEIITPETERILQEKAQEKALKKQQEKERLEREKLAELEKKNQTVLLDVDVPDCSMSRDVKAESVVITKADKKDNNKLEITAKTAPGKSPTTLSSFSWTPPRTTPKVFLKYSYDPMNNKTTEHETVTRSEAGVLLKQEIEETKRREEEFRQMRKSLKEELLSRDLTLPSTSQTAKPKVAYPLTPAAVIVLSNQPVTTGIQDDSVVGDLRASTPPTAALSAAAETSLFGTAVNISTADVTLSASSADIKDRQDGEKIRSAEEKGSKQEKQDENIKKGPIIVEVEMTKDSQDDKNKAINEQTPQTGDELIASERKRERLALIREWEKKIIYGASSVPHDQLN